MDTKQKVILGYFTHGKSQRELSRELDIHRKTVRRYIEEYDRKKQVITNRSNKSESIEIDVLAHNLSLPPKYDSSTRKRRKLTEELCKKLEDYVAKNEQKRQQGLSKQCMAKKDMWESLRSEGYEIGYTAVCNYVKRYAQRRKDVFIRQEMPSGMTAEFDWGHVKLNINGKVQKALLAVFTLKHSCHRWARLYYREDGLSFGDAHVHYFAHTGHVPKEMVYDNAKVMVRRQVERQKEATERLQELSLYYGFEYRFTNAYSGHEKGSVEKSVEYVRRKAFCNKDSFTTLQQANDHLSVCLKELNLKTPRGRQKSAQALFDHECSKMNIAAPAYNCFEQHTVRVNKYGCVTIDTNHYSIPNSSIDHMVQVRKYADKLLVYNDDEVLLAKHTRRYSAAQYYIQLEHYLTVFKRKPGALARSTALAQSDEYIKKLWRDYYQDDPRGFVAVLEYCTAKGFTSEQLLQAHIECCKHCSSGDKLSLDKIKVFLLGSASLPLASVTPHDIGYELDKNQQNNVSQPPSDIRLACIQQLCQVSALLSQTN